VPIEELTELAAVRWVLGQRRSRRFAPRRRERMARLVEEHPFYVRRIEFLYVALHTPISYSSSDDSSDSSLSSWLSSM
jgi:hypothetical protein